MYLYLYEKHRFRAITGVHDTVFCPWYNCIQGVNTGMDGKKECCETCWYWSDPFTSVCVNDKSRYCADYVEKETYCPEYCKKLSIDDIREDEDGNNDR